MAEELSPESKLYVKEEIDKIRKDFKEDLKEAQSKATKTFTTVALIVGLLAGVGIWSSNMLYIKDKMSTADITILMEDAKAKHEKILGYEAYANDFLSKLTSNRLTEKNGYVWIGDVKFVWGTVDTTARDNQVISFGEHRFPNACLAVIPELPGDVDKFTPTEFTYNRLDSYPNVNFTYLAIGY